MTHLFKRDHCEKATSYSLSLFAGIHAPARPVLGPRLNEIIWLTGTARSTDWTCGFLTFSMTKVTSIFVSSMPTLAFFSFWNFLTNHSWIIIGESRDKQWNVREWPWPWARSCAFIKIFVITAADIAFIFGLKKPWIIFVLPFGKTFQYCVFLVSWSDSGVVQKPVD